MEQNVLIQKLYYRYKRREDEKLREYLSQISLVRKTHKGVGAIVGYYPLTEQALAKIKEKPRNVSLTFDATETIDEPTPGLQEYKTITFLVKSTSRFFLKPDIGEVFDQIESQDLWHIQFKAICVNEEYEELEGTDGEHFLMTATLLIDSSNN